MNTVRPNKSASRTVDILEFVAARKAPVSMADICKELGFPKSSTFELIYTLIDKGFLQFADENLKTFKLGLKLYQTGMAFLSNSNLHNEARPVIENLALVSGHTVLLAVEHQGKIVYLDKAEPPDEVIRIDAQLGSSNPVHCTGLGKALLAAYSNEKVKAITEGKPLTPKTAFSITKHDELLKELERIRKRGFSIDNKESEINVYCVAAPIYDSFDNPVAAISMRCLASSIDPETTSRLGQLITENALLISRKLGFLKQQLYF